jgi:hypothetical protein
MESLKRAQAMMGNRNAAGPRLKKAGAAILKPLKTGVKTTAGWIRDGAIVGGAVGATYGAHASNKLASALGMKSAKHVVAKQALGYALKGAKTNIPTALLAGAGMAGYDAYTANEKAKRSIKGRLSALDKKVSNSKLVKAAKARVKNV